MHRKEVRKRQRRYFLANHSGASLYVLFDAEESRVFSLVHLSRKASTSGYQKSLRIGYRLKKQSNGITFIANQAPLSCRCKQSLLNGRRVFSFSIVCVHIVIVREAVLDSLCYELIHKTQVQRSLGQYVFFFSH